MRLEATVDSFRMLYIRVFENNLVRSEKKIAIRLKEGEADKEIRGLVEEEKKKEANNGNQVLCYYVNEEEEMKDNREKFGHPSVVTTKFLRTVIYPTYVILGVSVYTLDELRFSDFFSFYIKEIEKILQAKGMSALSSDPKALETKFIIIPGAKARRAVVEEFVPQAKIDLFFFPEKKVLSPA